jgi:hypothetical protein
MSDFAARHGRLVGYLLGTLTDPDRDAVEQEYFADPGALEEITAVEDDLFDDYMSGDLNDDLRHRFEERYLSSTEGVERLRLSENLARWTREKSRKSRQSVFRFLFSWYPEPHAVAAQELTAAKPLASAEDSGEIRVDLPDKGILRLDVQFPGDTGVRTYDLRLLASNLTEVWKSEALRAAERGSTNHLTVDIPVNLLQSGHFVLVLSGDGGVGLREMFRQRLLVRHSSSS